LEKNAVSLPNIPQKNEIRMKLAALIGQSMNCAEKSSQKGQAESRQKYIKLKIA